MIRTIVRESERNGDRLSFKKYKEMTAEARGVSLTPAMMQKRHKFNLAKGNPKIEKQKERQVATVVESKKSLSFWQKVKNLFNQKGR